MAREEKILEQLDQLSRMALGVDSDVDRCGHGSDHSMPP
jgi:hypothetical protein